MPDLPDVRDPLVAEHDARHPERARRVAVGVLAGAGRRRRASCAKSPPAVEQPRATKAPFSRASMLKGLGAVRARVVLVPLLLDELPGLRPVGRVLPAPRARRGRPGRRRSPRGSSRPARGLAGIGLEEGRRVHPAEEHPAVEAVAVVHHPTTRSAYLFASRGSPGHMRPMKSDSIWKSMSFAWRLYFGVPGLRRLHPVVEQPSRGGVRVPEVVLRALEHLAVLLARGREADAVHDLGEGHLHVEVVLVDRVLHPLGPTRGSSRGCPRRSCRSDGTPSARRRTRRSSGPPSRRGPCPRRRTLRGGGGRPRAAARAGTRARESVGAVNRNRMIGSSGEGGARVAWLRTGSSQCAQ